MIPKINHVFLGNRKAGNFPVGDVEQISVLTMFDKLDQMIKDIPLSAGQITPDGGIMKTMYEDVCNYGHINFNAHISVGRLYPDGVWRAKQNVDGYKEELYGFYMPGLTMSISTILLCCSMIVRNSKVQNFDLLANPLFFSAT